MNTPCATKKLLVVGAPCCCKVGSITMLLLILAIIQPAAVNANNISSSLNQPYACFEHFSGSRYPVCPHKFGPTNCTVDKYECWEYCSSRDCAVIYGGNHERCDCDVGRAYCTEGYNPCDVQTDMPSPQPIEDKSFSNNNNNMCHAYITGYDYDSTSTKTEPPKPLTCDSDFGVWVSFSSNNNNMCPFMIVNMILH